jgi:hypothetical protein
MKQIIPREARMSISITSVTLQGNTAFVVGGATSAGDKQVQCQAFIGQTAASPQGTTTSDDDGNWSITLTLNSAYQSGQFYEVVATSEDSDSADVTVPPFFTNPPPPPPPPGP